MPVVGAAGLVAVLAGVSAALLLPGPIRMRSGKGSQAGFPVPALALVVALVALALSSWLSTQRLVLVGLAAAASLGFARMVRRRRRTRAAEQRSDQVLAACDSMASDLAAGQPPLRSLDRVAEDWPEFASVAVAGQMGADVPGALRELGALPGGRQLCHLAAAWQVAHGSGAGLAKVLGETADSMRSHRRTARLVAAELAAAHATARMLAVLPLGVLLLGSGIGGDPVGFLVGSTPGLVCLAMGLALSFAGLFWLERIADGVLSR